MRRLAILLPLLVLSSAAAEPTLQVQYPEDSFYDEDGTPLVPVAPGNAYSLEVRVTDGGEPVKNARVRFANQVTGAVDTAWTNSDGVAARGQYAGSDETWWDVDVSIDCVMDATTGDCVDVADEPERVRVAWTRIQLSLEGPASAKTGSEATLRTSAVWTALGTSVPDGRVRVVGGGDSEYAYVVDGEAVTLHSRADAATVDFTATMDAYDRPAAVPVLPSDVLRVEFRDDAPQQEPGQPTDEAQPTPRPSDEGQAVGDDEGEEEAGSGNPGDDSENSTDDTASDTDPSESSQSEGTDDAADGGDVRDTPAPQPLAILWTLAVFALLQRRS